MNTRSPLCRATRGYPDFPEKEFNVVRKKRQRILSNNLLTWFTPKHYPCIFFDQRLRSRFFK